MVQRITIAPQGPEFSRFVMGYWRLMDWNMSARQLVSFIEEHLDLGVTTVDHADIYGGYQCEAAFGEALKLAPHLRERMEIVSKCGIATTAREENVIGHYITDRDHIRAEFPSGNVPTTRYRAASSGDCSRLPPHGSLLMYGLNMNTPRIKSS